MRNHLTDTIAAAGLNVHAVEVICRSKIILHHAFHPDIRYPVYSATKSLTAAAFAMMTDDGLLSSETPLAELLPHHYQPLMTDCFCTLPLRRFLSMTAGAYPFRPAGDDWLAETLRLPVNHNDTSFHYSNIPAYLVGAALEHTLGTPLIQYLNTRLFSPMEIPLPTYQTDPQGRFYGATGMTLTVHELAQIGQLLLQNGAWNERQLISKCAVHEMMQPHAYCESDAYGYFIWLSKDHAAISGKWGQKALIYPDKQLVIAYTANLPEKENARKMLQIAEQYAEEFAVG